MRFDLAQSRFRTPSRAALGVRGDHRCLHADRHNGWVHTGVHFEVQHAHPLMGVVTIDISHIERRQSSAARPRGSRARKARLEAQESDVARLVVVDEAAIRRCDGRRIAQALSNTARAGIAGAGARVGVALGRARR